MQRPGTVAWEQLQVWKLEQREREKLARRKRPDFIGPPNPYKGKLRPVELERARLLFVRRLVTHRGLRGRGGHLPFLICSARGPCFKIRLPP